MDWNSWFGLWGGMGIMMLIGMAFWVIFWGGIIFLIIWAITKLSRRPAASGQQDLLGIAKGRYARGEITKEQFEQLKKDIEA